MERTIPKLPLTDVESGLSDLTLWNVKRVQLVRNLIQSHTYTQKLLEYLGKD